MITSRNQSTNKCYFVIKYISEKNSYDIKDMGDGTGTFIKINDKYTLKDNYTVCFYNTFIKISFTDLL